MIDLTEKFLFMDENNILCFNYSRFVKMKSEIYLKYEPSDIIESLERSHLNCQWFSNHLDKYILHTIEEVIEALDEYQKGSNPLSFENEIIDIINYLGTIGSILELYLNKNHIYFNEKIDISDTPISYDYYDMTFLDIISDLIFMRRLNPERKWHKPHPCIDKEKFIDRVKKIRASMVNIHNDAINLLVDTLRHTLSCENEIGILNDLNRKIIEKHNFIMELPKQSFDEQI